MATVKSPTVYALREQARALPEAPGVYFWVDSEDSVLYIGKALNLRARVSSYFSTAVHDRRIRDLVTGSTRIEYEVTATELEALFRESVLIKRERPRFNRALTSTRPQYYLKLDVNHEDPYLETTRTVDDDDSLYIGPFRSTRILRETMEYLHAVLPLRKCARKNPKCRPCIYFQMGTCAAPILGGEYRQRHREAIDKLQHLVDGRTHRVTDWLEGKRDRLSETLQFERAAEVQERLDALHDSRRKQHMLDIAVQSRCVLVHQTASMDDPGRVLLVARGTVVFTRHIGQAQPDQIVRWIRIHEAVIEATKVQGNEVDAAGVLQRWLATTHSHVRWVAIPPNVDDDDLLERVRDLLRTLPSEKPAEPIHEQSTTATR